MRLLVVIFVIPSLIFSQIKVDGNQIKNSKVSIRIPGWEEIGPKNFPGTEEERGLTGVGPLKYFCIHPKNHDEWGANSIYGGLFLSNDKGKSWTNSGSDSWPSSMCTWFSYHPTDPNIIVALSIVQPTKHGGNMGMEGGVLITFNHGAKWEKIGDYKDFGGDRFTSIFKVVLTEDYHCYVASDKGLFYCKDVSSEDPIWENLLPDTWLSDIELLGEILLVSGKKNEDWFIKRVKISKNTFNQVDFNFDAKGLSNIKFETVRGKEDHFYYVAQFESKPDFLILSDLEGKMEILNEKMLAVFGFGLSLAVNPENENEIFAGYGVTLQRSEDGGKNFTTVNGKYHVDIEGICYHPVKKNDVFIFTHGGLYESKDHGKNWKNVSDGMGIAEVMGMGVGSQGFPIAIGLFHDGSIVYSMDSIWRHITPGDGINSYVAWDDNRYVYVSNQHSAGGLFVSKDSGRTFANAHKLAGQQTSGWSMAFVQNTRFPENFYFNYKRKYTPGLSEGFDVILSKNRGLSDFHIISDFNKTHGLKKYNLFDMYINPNKPGSIYAYLLISDSGELEHRLFRNDSTLSSNLDSILNYWNEIEMPINTWIGDIEFSSIKDEEIFIIKGSEDFIGSDEEFGKAMVYRVNLERKYNCSSGKNCEDITWNLPNAYVDKWAAYVDHKKNRLFIGTNQGLYYLDLVKMDQWKKFGRGLPNVVIKQIQVSEDGKYIYVGTRGRGVWKHPY
ncbi:MAG: hypothetical protein R2799_08800 [Crocinitomicaceae bacterium]